MFFKNICIALSEILKFREIEVKFKKISSDAIVPCRMSEEAAGYDLYADENATLKPSERKLIKTGIGVALPKGFHLEIRPRSGLALKHGITVLNTPGTVDSDYRGELQVTLINLGAESYEIRKGDRIAQAILMRQYAIRWKPTEILKKSKRGSSGWGHSGR